MKKIVLIIWGLLLVFSAFAQMEYPRKFLKKLERGHLAFYEPVEGRFRSFKVPKNDIFKPDFAIASRIQDLEIQYAIRYNKSNALNVVPHLQGLNIALTLTSNIHDEDIAVEFFSDKQLEELELDWAAQFDFVPKQALTTKKHGTLIALQRAKSNASAYLIFYYNQPDLDFIHYYDTLQFELQERN